MININRLITVLVFILGLFLGSLSVLWFQAMSRESERIKEEGIDSINPINIEWRKDHFILNDFNLYNELVAQGIDYPDIVQAQAKLETGNYKSYSCKVRNNLFGLRNANGTYMSFEHWTDAVAAYKKYIQKYDTTPANYYDYLHKLGYAEDKEYTIKLRQLVGK